MRDGDEFGGQNADIHAGAEVMVPGADIEKDVPDAAAFFFLSWNLKFPAEKDHHLRFHSLCHWLRAPAF